jgi:protein phosphatase
VGWVTDVGRRREENEDALVVETLPGGGLLAAVADGMGGLAHGSVASAEAIAALRAAIGADASAAGLVQGFHDAHWRIRALKPADREPMGTTLVAVLLDEAGVYVANVGDSRAYMIESGAAVPLTRDHSLVAEQVAAGLIDVEAARISPARSVLTRALGPDPALPEVDLFGPFDLAPGACLLLCSDGLHTLVSDDEIASAVRHSPPQGAAGDLVALANERGGSDNITVVVVANT